MGSILSINIRFYLFNLEYESDEKQLEVKESPTTNDLILGRFHRPLRIFGQRNKVKIHCLSITHSREKDSDL